MAVFSDLTQFAVHQRHEKTGCIPTCYEMLLSVGGLPVRGATGSPVNPIAIG